MDKKQPKRGPGKPKSRGSYARSLRPRRMEGIPLTAWQRQSIALPDRAA